MRLRQDLRWDKHQMEKASFNCSKDAILTADWAVSAAVRSCTALQCLQKLPSSLVCFHNGAHALKLLLADVFLAEVQSFVSFAEHRSMASGREHSVVLSSATRSFAKVPLS